jgi:hypothetical protein
MEREPQKYKYCLCPLFCVGLKRTEVFYCVFMNGNFQKELKGDPLGHIATRKKLGNKMSLEKGK